MRRPSLPERDAGGNRPAIATAQAVLARQVIRARQAMKLSRRELAQRAGISAETLARIESGHHTPRAVTMRKLTSVLGEL